MTVYKRVLLFEPDEELLDSLGLFLSKKGYLVGMASNCDDAVKLLNSSSFNCAVSDLDFPGDISPELERRAIFPYLHPVLFIGQNPSLRNDNFYLGPSFFLQKPFGAERFLEEVERMFR